ncbi:beta-fructofuranosidase [Aureococcus anophagefferens]|nr:beta-fructofuranosidase [Aureococcus anophagefferens]
MGFPAAKGSMFGFSAGCTLLGFLLPVVASWPAPVVDYRAVLYTDNATAIALAAAALRTWMAANDPDYPPTTSRDLVHWEEWPAIVGDSEWDWRAVYSGNCALDDRGDPVCVYTGGRAAPCDTGVCATSGAPTTFRPSATGSPLGAAEGPGTYWELPYLLGFDEHGTALPNDAIEDASTTALLFGEGGNKYFFGSLADDVSFSRAWAEPKETDAFPPYYSFNPHATDEVDGTTRRLMFGWILVFGPTSRVSAAAEAGRVPPWDGAHSLCRAVTADVGAGALVQAPCPETRALRGIRAGALANKRLADGVFVGLSNVGDALDVVASFDVGDADFIGLSVRVLDDFSCDVVWNVSAATLTAGVDPPWPAVYPPAPTDPVELEVFVDRSIVDVYFFGAALTSRCALPASLHDELARRGAVPSEVASVRAFSKGGTATLARLEAWTMGSMWS